MSGQIFLLQIAATMFLIHALCGEETSKVACLFPVGLYLYLSLYL